MGRLSTLAESQNDEIRLSSHSIESAHSVVLNDARTPRKNNTDSSGLLLKGSNMLSEGYQHAPTVDSPEDSLDSDMFSISDSSDDVELLNPREIMYPILNNILHRLLAGFRTVTRYQSSPGEGEAAGASWDPASIAESSQPGHTSRSSQKRKLPHEEEDDTGEDGSPAPPLKNMKQGQNKKPPKSFTCPYLKWDSIKFRRCCKMKLSRISDVKNHLIRKHYSEDYCQLCQETFADDQSLQRHIIISKYSRRDISILIGISHRQRSQLHKKSKANASREDQ
ncbi:hypothetical protein BGZ57DRAFT_929659 [Hyaloscypha finlandica]|nr:hypothetical protein BGZ57DRAFT_929659 [Hyaloscypha finlandica]